MLIIIDAIFRHCRLRQRRRARHADADACFLLDILMLYHYLRFSSLLAVLLLRHYHGVVFEMPCHYFRYICCAITGYRQRTHAILAQRDATRDAMPRHDGC